MCGLAGIINSESISNKKKVLDKMLLSLKHRGPDFTGEWFDEEIALGHNRLSIIDLSKVGNQPFISNCGNYVLVYNGEIYNYIELRARLPEYNFKSNSDSEVVLAAFLKWGKSCMHEFNGMFAFAIWDKTNNSLFAARDRFGVKPFYFSEGEKSFFFASEIKALHNASVPKKYNKKVWANYFVYGSYGMPNETFWESIHQLPAGYSLEYKLGDLNINRWYIFEKEIEKYKKNLSFNEVKEQYTKLLKDCIKLRFRSDVKVGFNVSGGLDSSALLAFVNLRGDSDFINAYTFYTNNSLYDELPWVEEMISFTGNPLTRVLLEANSNLKQKIKDVAFYQDEPFGGIPTVAYSEIFKQARRDKTIVLLDGQGMDEQWAGYDYYMNNSDNNTIQGVSKNPFKPEILSVEFKDLAEKPIYPQPFKDSVMNKQYRDLFYTKIPRALRFNDRISMMYSTELREPFLDHKLVEFAFAQPLDYKIRNGIQKYLLRKIVGEYLSKNITYAPKRSLQTPQREWLGEELKELVEASIFNLKKSEVANWFDFAKMEREWKSYKDGNRESSFHIWQLVNLSIFLN